MTGALAAHRGQNLLDQRHRAEEVRLEVRARPIETDLFDTPDQAIAGVID